MSLELAKTCFIIQALFGFHAQASEIFWVRVHAPIQRVRSACKFGAVGFKLQSRDPLPTQAQKRHEGKRDFSVACTQQPQPSLPLEPGGLRVVRFLRLVFQPKGWYSVVAARLSYCCNSRQVLSRGYSGGELWCLECCGSGCVLYGTYSGLSGGVWRAVEAGGSEQVVSGTYQGG